MSAPVQTGFSVRPTRASGRKWAWRAVAVAAGATVVAGSWAWAAGGASAPGADGPTCPHMAGGPGMALHGGPGMGGPMGDPGMMLSGRHLDHLLDDVKASDEQRKQIQAIAAQARKDLEVMHEEGRKLHEEGLALWSAPKLDEQAIEAHRQHMLAQHERVSRRAMEAMLAAGRVLQPEQRAQLVQRMRDHQQGHFERMKAHFQHRMGSGGQPLAASQPPSAANRAR